MHKAALSDNIAQMIEAGRRLWQRGLVAANDGNLSCRRDTGFLITRSGVSKGFLLPEDILELDAEWQKVAGEGLISSEYRLHQALYAADPQIRAIVHAHPPYATAYALSEADLNDCPLEEIRIQLGRIARLPFAPAGSREVAELAAAGMAGARAGLMLRHGTLTVGEDMEQAYFRMEALEQAAQIAWLAHGLR
ncbi:MAG: class II aldolase/adducin family protein [Clostridia bacterium]|nr:class II aldolase/adducin family protein [Clostridia bacterium]